MSTVCVDQDHQIVGKTRVLDVGVFAVACGLLGSLEHTVHLIEVDITKQWGDHSALRDATATVRFQHDLQQVHHVIIVDSLRYLGQQLIVAAQIKIYDARLALNDRLGYAVYCFMSCLLGTIPKRSRLEVTFSGWRSTPGRIPATSQLSLLSSTTTVNVWLGSNGVGERLRSLSGFFCCFGLRIDGLHRLGFYLRRLSHRFVYYFAMDAVVSPLS